ncbi:MAG TPA: prolyl oligopeptidase family serine peptidase [Pseudacidobacterium sp.]|nr:prolyl oligopeptidase family serine peptidase [Pseudacidobacterium sp.]
MKKAAGIFLCLCGFLAAGYAQDAKPPITLDEFMNATDVRIARIAPDGQAVVVWTNSPDWQHNRFRDDLWLWQQKTSGTVPLTQSGYDSQPAWSPDGKYISFLSSRALSDDSGGDDDKDETERVWVIPVAGGEAFPIYTEKLDAHAFAWSADGTKILFSIRQPLTKAQEDARKEDWKDVIRWREQERGDVLLAVSLQAAITENQKTPSPHAAPKRADDEQPLPKMAQVLTKNDRAITEIAPAQGQIAFETGTVSKRMEGPEAYEIFLVNGNGGEAKQLTHNDAVESGLRWSPDGKRLYFNVRAAAGSLEGKYQDVQGRLYAMDPATARVERLGADFRGSLEDYTVADDGSIIVAGLTGTEQQFYKIDGSKAEPLKGEAGTYSGVDAALHSPRMVALHSTINDPTQSFVVDDASQLQQAKAITAFNGIFGERAKPEWTTYRWKADDGTEVEGVLIYPPGKKGDKHLRMVTLIHGGPADADGDRFGADWYDWATLAAANGWLVFRPNYRGSSGYGDKFMLEIEPHLVSRPGRDILEGVDALVRDGIADPDRLAIGGYSYGGYMTNWLITQTTRFKAAVTGAGAVEHAANWGNDDETYDDAWYLSGKPWEKPQLYQSEAALFQFNKVTTPTHLVGGNADIRVSYLEDVLMERALSQLGIPHSFLVFPGEGHSLDKNPWHGYIKVREELKWLDKYVGSDAAPAPKGKFTAEDK